MMQSARKTCCIYRFFHCGYKSQNVTSLRCLSVTQTSQSTSTTSNVDLVRHLRARIKSNGPLTIAEYMKEVLTNPLSGYYMKKDVFGFHGDFTTSPEISQMFGELVGIWCLNEWMHVDLTKTLQVVELGPGRGTLADDMLRAISRFSDVRDNVSLHLVEVSPALSDIQESKLSGKKLEQIQAEASTRSPDTASEGGHYKQCISKYGQPVYWYQSLQDVPYGLSCFIAHEFLDALPIHKFQKTDRGWCEVMINYDDDSSSFKFVLSPGATAASTAFLQVSPSESRDHIEVCPDAGRIVQELCKRILSHQGFALLADYGHSAEKTDTFRAFKNHQLHDVLVDPGTADLTADVDFTYLRNMTEATVSTYGPLTQQEFLHNMGIGVRLQVLLQKADQEAWKDLISGYDMLTNPKKMGERFKFLALMNPRQKDYIPAGFVTPEALKQSQ
ncbi:protein arginine methyltransferase NDUFAF7, mitochondrial-like [Haliotis asinina]|uniref:protein arginine methyltransferase NDUFAF7, mitochondrial-like n=1 Tax=Haliotis asinina TaxID=109174 RepID=UPI003531E4D4